MDKENIKYILVMVVIFSLVFSLVSAEKAVKLKLRTTSCKNSCTHYHDDKCPSSIKVDNREESKQKDGFNVVVINNYSGRVVDSKNFRWFNNLMFWKRSEFKRFFKNINHNSTVIIVFQNICKQFETEWYENLKELRHNIQKKLYSYQAVVIACKGTCPEAEDEKIPFTYYSSGIRFEKTMTLLFRAAPQPPPPPRYIKDDNDIPVIAGSVTGAIIIVTICYAVYLYYRQRNPHDESYYGSFPDNLPRDDPYGEGRIINNRTCPSSSHPTNVTNTHTDAIYEEIPHVAYPVLPNGKRGNIYETIDPSEIRRLRNQSPEGYDVPAALTDSPEYDYPTSVTHEYAEPTVTEPSAPPITLYVSMNHINEHYVTKQSPDVAEKSYYI